MRIISGKLGGRQFASPKGHRTHPMSEKVRGAVFSALGDISGFVVLDAFAGTGALAFEAISRGASSAVAIDIDRQAIAVLNKNVTDLALRGKVKVIQANLSTWADNNSQRRFDLVFCDPPYDDVKPELLEKVARHAASGAVIVFSLPPETALQLPGEHFEALAFKSYGDASLVFYRKLT